MVSKHKHNVITNSLVYACRQLSVVMITNTPFHFKNCLGLCNTLYGHTDANQDQPLEMGPLLN